MAENRERSARQRIGKNYIGYKSAILSVNTVTFQPRGVDKNHDRIVTDLWHLFDQRWLFLAVFDGHMGSTAADYTSKVLPTIIRRKLRAFIHSKGGRLDRQNVAEHEHEVTVLLKDVIERFDRSIGEAVVNICPRPWELTEEESRRLALEHTEVLERAFTGTTLSLALINIDQRFMWAAGVGDSSVGLSTVGSDGKVQSQRLCEMHTFKNPKEYYRAVMAHSYAEQPLFDWEDRILGWVNVARAIGGFSLKMHASYLANLFRYLPGADAFPLSTYIPKIVSPPYVISEPSVHFTDLQPVWKPGGKIFLFTDGVDNLVDGWLVFRPREHSGADPIHVVSALLTDHVDPQIEHILGHPIIPRWSGRENNRASDVLGNLLGGADVERLEMVTDMNRLDDETGWPFHIDDTSIIVWPLTDT
ncbi:protein serine/threonine phosphatase 2C [Pilatotrama ljubarskyi]|nr:protein serine/threonine phosphatase 2C [Pilatotrama ljubarskyi]